MTRWVRTRSGMGFLVAALAVLSLSSWAMADAQGDYDVLFGRAKAYCEHYLEVHTAQDASRLKGTMLLEKVSQDAAQIAVAGLAKTLTLDLGKGATMKLVMIPAGKFIMGSLDSEKDRRPEEGPQREVTISKPFYMGMYEVTQEQYEALIGRNPSEFQGRDRPVEKVSWNDAVEFCKKLSARTGKTVRLPTEAEWEYACRAGSKTRFCSGDDDKDLSGYAWYENNSKGKTHPSGEKKPNAFGLYDMHGNVWEWCGDWYGSYASASARDPAGPDSGLHRVLRGGCWGTCPAYCRSAYRYGYAPGCRNYAIGFRVSVESE